VEIRNSLGAKVKVLKCPEMPMIVGSIARIIQLTEMDMESKTKVRCMVLLDEPVTVPMLTVNGTMTGQGEWKTRGPFPSKGLYLEAVVTDTGIPDAFKKGWDSTGGG
jgi:hypothetical protein